MKKFLYSVLVLFLFFQINVFAGEQGKADKQDRLAAKSQKEIFQEKIVTDTSYIDSTNKDYKGVFWINLIIAAIGVISIYGFAAGIVSAGISYFIVNGDKKGFAKAIWGALIGIIIGLVVRAFMLM